MLAEDGTPLRSWASADGALRHPVQLAAVSPLYLQALLNYEDRWFYRHPGVNPAALARAAWQWARHGRIVSGGSTLTMQVARLIDPAGQAAGRSLPAKARQILRALQLELHLSKDEILTLYLNEAPMGGMIEGVEMATRAYLGKPARELSHAEAALLMALPQSPSRLRPDRAAAKAQAARDKVLTPHAGPRRLGRPPPWPGREAGAGVRAAAARPAGWRRWRPSGCASSAGRTRARSSKARSMRACRRGWNRCCWTASAPCPSKVSIAALVVDNQSLGRARLRRFGRLHRCQPRRPCGHGAWPALAGLDAEAVSVRDGAGRRAWCIPKAC